MSGRRVSDRRLTPRQREVLRLAANGNTNTRIAYLLGLSRPTVDRHLSDVYLRLGAADRTQAVSIALVIGELGIQDIYIPPQCQ